MGVSAPDQRQQATVTPKWHGFFLAVIAKYALVVHWYGCLPSANFVHGYPAAVASKLPSQSTHCICFECKHTFGCFSVAIWV